MIRFAESNLPAGYRLGNCRKLVNFLLKLPKFLDRLPNNFFVKNFILKRKKFL